MITEKEVRSKGFNNGNKYLISVYMQEGSYIDNPHHVMEHNGEFYFRGRGYTIAKINSLEHLEELMKQHIEGKV